MYCTLCTLVERFTPFFFNAPWDDRTVCTKWKGQFGRGGVALSAWENAQLWMSSPNQWKLNPISLGYKLHLPANVSNWWFYSTNNWTKNGSSVGLQSLNLPSGRADFIILFYTLSHRRVIVPKHDLAATWQIFLLATRSLWYRKRHLTANKTHLNETDAGTGCKSLSFLEGSEKISM